jgi:hypothetical protein
MTEITPPSPPAAFQPTPAAQAPVAAQVPVQEPVMTSPEPTASAPEVEAAPVKKPRKKRGPNKKKVLAEEAQQTTVSVVLVGKYPGFHARHPSIKFLPFTPVDVPNDGWTKAQLEANYLRLA